LEQPHELRAQAKWLRGWADFGTDADRAWREGLADYLEKLAGEIEYMQTRDDQRKRAA
jgi:hypothetical protein